MRSRSTRRQRGSILWPIFFFLVVCVILGLTAIELSGTSSRVAFRAARKHQATALAEAGVHALYDEIRTAVASGTAYPANRATQTLSATVGGRTYAEGTYAASVVQTASVSGGTELTIEGVGTVENGVTSRVRARIVVSEPARMAAILSNTTATIRTDGGFRITDTTPGRNEASLLANDGVTWETVGTTKAAQTNPNVLDIQGQIMVARGPDPAYALTVGASGLGNANGSTNYMTVAKPAESVPANAVQGVARRSFPSSAQVSTWQATWRAAAQAGTVFGGSLNTAGVPLDTPTGEPRIVAPAYIDGDLTIDAGQVYLQPSADPSASNVVYVRGNVSNLALLYNRGVKLIVEGEYSGSGLYELQTQYSPYATLADLYPVAALVSLSPTATAITVATSASGPSGLVYAANGGVTAVGNNEMRGILVSGGVGGVTVAPPGGASFVAWYQPESVTARTDELLALSGGSNNSTASVAAPRYWSVLR